MRSPRRRGSRPHHVIPSDASQCWSTPCPWLGPIIGGLATWGLDILTGTAPGSGEQVRQVFDRAWTVDHATAELQESYQWRIDGVDFELAVEGGGLIRTPGRCARPAVTLIATNAALADVVTGRRSVTEAIDGSQLELKGSKAARRRMFEVIGFPLVRLGF